MLEDLKDELDLDGFFEAMGASKLKATSNGYSMSCLHPNHGDRGPSLHYRTSSHKFKCYGCGFKGDIIDIVREVKGLRFRKAIGWIKEFAGWSASTTDKQLTAILDRRDKQKQGDDEDGYSTVVEPAYFETDFSNAGDAIQLYIERRGWSEDLLAMFGVGYCRHGFFRDRIIFPVYDRDDGLTTFAARAVWDVNDSAGEMRYLYPLKSQLSRSIWPINKPIDGTPIFVEGCPDALRLREYGYNAYAILGNQLGDVKLNLIRKLFSHHKSLMILPDNDKGGEIMKEWFGKLVHEFEILVASINSGGKDIDEVGLSHGKGAVDKIIQGAVLFQDLDIEKRYKFTKAPTMVTELVTEDERVLHSSSEFRVMNQVYWAAR